MLVRTTTMKKWNGAPCTEADINDLDSHFDHAEFYGVVTRMITDGEIAYRNVSLNDNGEIIATVLFVDDAKATAFETETTNMAFAKDVRRTYDVTVTKKQI